MRIVIAEGNEALGALLKQELEGAGMERCLPGDDRLDGGVAGPRPQVEWAGDAAAAVSLFLQVRPDLVIVDLDLEGRAGSALLRFIRSVDDEVRVVGLTARPLAEAKVECLDIGADDCMTKPLSLDELCARCRALLRRRRGPPLVLRNAGVRLDRLSRRAEHEGRNLDLSGREFALLESLMLEAGSCVSRASLLERVWKVEPDSNVVDVHVNYLRGKLRKASVGAGPMGTRLRDGRGVARSSESLIRTVRGKGYCMVQQGDCWPQVMHSEDCEAGARFLAVESQRLPITDRWAAITVAGTMPQG